MAQGLPLFESVWVDALAQAGAITAFQAAEINSQRAEELRVGPYLLDSPLEFLHYGIVYAAHAAEQHPQGATPQTVRLVVVDFTAAGVAEEPSVMLPRLRQLVADLRPFVNALQEPLAASPGILPVVDAGIDGDRAWAACPAVAARTAAEWMVRKGRFAPEAVLEIARQTAAALAELQRRGLSHGDLRAQTLLLAGEGRVLLAYPGLRAVFFPREDRDAAGLPPEAYDGLSPERWSRGELPSPAGDIYACGCLWWHMLAARPVVFGASGAAKMRAAASFDVPDVRPLAPDTPPVLAEAIAACTARNAAARPQSCDELVEMLGEGSGGGRRLLTRSFTPPGRMRLRRRRLSQKRKTLLIAIACAAAALLCLAVVAAEIWFIAAQPDQGESGKLAAGLGDETPNRRAGKQPVAPYKQLIAPDKQPVEHIQPLEPPDAQLAAPDKQPAAAGESVLLDEVVKDVAALNLQRGQTVKPKGTGRVRFLVPPGGLIVDRVDVRFERIDFYGAPADVKVTESKIGQDDAALVDLRASGAVFAGCTFSSPEGKAAAVRWTYPSGSSHADISLFSGRMGLENCVFTGVSAAVDCRVNAAVSLRAANVLHLARGPLLRLSRLPRADEPLSLVLDRVTLRESGPLMECRAGGEGDKAGRISIESIDSVFMPAEGVGLLVFLGEASSRPFLERIEWSGQGSLVGVNAPVAQLLRSPENAKTLDEGAISIAGLVRSKVEFAGAAVGGAAASRLLEWQAPVRSADPPGVDVSRLPGGK